MNVLHRLFEVHERFNKLRKEQAPLKTPMNLAVYLATTGTLYLLLHAQWNSVVWMYLFGLTLWALSKPSEGFVERHMSFFDDFTKDKVIFKVGDVAPGRLMSIHHVPTGTEWLVGDRETVEKIIQQAGATMKNATEPPFTWKPKE